jgi:hypothetical protein
MTLHEIKNWVWKTSRFTATFHSYAPDTDPNLYDHFYYLTFKIKLHNKCKHKDSLFLSFVVDEEPVTSLPFTESLLKTYILEAMKSN